MEILKLASVVTVTTFVGWNVLYLLRGRRSEASFPEQVAVAYGLGVGCISLEMLCFYFLKLNFEPAFIMGPWVLIILRVAALRAKDIKEGGVIRREDMWGKGNPLLAGFLLFGITLEVVFAFFRALIKPLESYDAVAIYAIKSKIIFLAKALTVNFFTETIKAFPHPDYPLSIPIFESFTCLMMGAWNDQLVKIIFPVFFAALLVFCYCSIKRFASRNYALLFTFLLASIPQLTAYATNGYLDLPLAFYYFVSAVFLFRWIQDSKRVEFLVLSSVMVGMAAWAKNEGLLYCLINVFLVGMVTIQQKRPVGRLILYTFIIALINLPWLIIKKHSHIVNEEIFLWRLNPVIFVRQLYKIVPILYEFQRQLFGPKKWNIVWILVVLTAALKYKDLFRGLQKYITLSLALAVSGYIVFYMISIVEINFFLCTTWSRFLLHFLPVAVYWMAYILKDDIKI